MRELRPLRILVLGWLIAHWGGSAPAWAVDAQSAAPRPPVCAVLPSNLADAIVPPRFVLAWGRKGTADGQFRAPIGIAISANDDVYVTDPQSTRVQRFTTDGVFRDKFSPPGFPGGIAVDGDGRIYVASMLLHKISVYLLRADSSKSRRDPQPYELVREWGKKGTADGQFDQPGGLAFAPDGTLYVCDQVNHRIQRFSPEGKFLGKWGKYGDAPGDFGKPEPPSHRVGGPSMAGFDRKGNLLTTEPTAGRIQCFSPAGQPLGSWGGNAVRKGAFGGGDTLPGPIGIAFDRDNRAWVSATNHRVQLFTADGRYLSGLGKTADAGQEPSQFDTPHGIAIDGRGSIYVVDTLNRRVQKFAFAAEH